MGRCSAKREKVEVKRWNIPPLKLQFKIYETAFATRLSQECVSLLKIITSFIECRHETVCFELGLQVNLILLQRLTLSLKVGFIYGLPLRTVFIISVIFH